MSVINGQDDSLLPASYSKGVMHMKHLLKFKTVIFNIPSVPFNQSPLRRGICVSRVFRFSSICSVSLQSEAQELTIVKMSKFGGGIGAPSKEERLKEAADIHLRLGQIQRYCELMVELGQVVVRSCRI